MKLVNNTELVFATLEDDWREYDYVVDGKVVTFRVVNPRHLNVHPQHGAHRLLDANGVAHYMPGNFTALRWKVAPGTPHFHYTVPYEPVTEAAK
jgi:hypothetical protein